MDIQEVQNRLLKGLPLKGVGLNQPEWPIALFTVATICAAMLFVPPAAVLPQCLRASRRMLLLESLP